MITYGELKTQLRSVLWPSPTEARNLREAHDLFFKEAMVDLAKWVPCLRVDNQDLFDFCGTYVQCAKTIVEKPKGLIKRVYTIANDDWCDPVYYRSRSFPEVEAFARKVSVGWVSPTNTGMDPLPSGFRFAESSTDSQCGRSRIGIYAIRDGRLYLAPWIQSNETVVVEWDGWKRDWKEDEHLDDDEWDEHVQAAIRAYVKWKHEVYYGCDPVRRVGFQREYEDLRADAAYFCARKTKENLDEVLPDDRDPTSAEVKDDAVPDPDEQIVYFANIGDYGNLTFLPAEAKVASLVASKLPDFVVTNGDNDYNGDYDQTVGQYYSAFIYPYSGVFGTGADENKFFPAPGNHDWDYDGTLDAYKAFFSKESGYYEFVKGPVHFFMLDSDTREPDGRTSSSKQGQWLQTKLALSPAQWKIVVIHHAPYNSTVANGPGQAQSRWPFKEWGADLVLSGHSHLYERLEVDGLAYIVNGAGGAELEDTFGTILDGSMFRYNGFGAGFCRIDCTSLIYEFYDFDGNLLDTLTIEK